MPFAAVAAVIGGDLAVATIFTAVAEVGTALSVVGAVTGDKGLMQVGAVMGIAGGVGGFVSGLGGAVTNVAGDMGVQTEAQVAAGSDAFANNFSQYATTGTDAASIAGDVAGDVGNMSNLDTSAGANMPSPDPSSSSSGLNANLSSDLTTPLSTPTATPLPSTTPPAPMDAGTGAPMPPTTAAGDGTAASQLTGGQATAAQNTSVSDLTAAGKTRNDILAGFPTDSNSFFGGMTGFVKNNQTMLGQLASGAMSGMGKAYEADRNFQQKTLDSERNYGINKSLLDLRTQQQGFGNSSPNYNFNASGVNYGAAQPLPPGIINGARSQ